MMETDNEQNNLGAAFVPPQKTGTEMNAVEKIELASEAEAVYFLPGNFYLLGEAYW